MYIEILLVFKRYIRYMKLKNNFSEEKLLRYFLAILLEIKEKNEDAVRFSRIKSTFMLQVS